MCHSIYAIDRATREQHVPCEWHPWRCHSIHHLPSQEQGWYNSSNGTRKVETSMERWEAWSAGSVFFVFLTGVIAPRHARYRALNRVERRLSAYVSYHISALWSASGDCRPGHSGDTVAPPLCGFARPRRAAARPCPRSSPDYAPSSAPPAALSS